jgi:hypothetical protein
MDRLLLSHSDLKALGITYSRAHLSAPSSCTRPRATAGPPPKLAPGLSSVSPSATSSLAVREARHD